jgi:sulfur relay (sulfurtransferase) complex TusBCD TusD component (DsrE family)
VVEGDVVSCLALVVSDPAAVDRALAIAAEARSRAVEVGLFVMSDAVAALPGRRAALLALADDHVDLVCCAASASQRGLTEDRLAVMLGSQDDHAALIARADRVLAFT